MPIQELPPEICNQFKDLAGRLEKALREYDTLLLTMQRPTEEVGLARDIAMYSGDAARETMKWLADCAPDAIVPVGYVREKLTSAQRSYDRLASMSKVEE